MSEEQVAPVEDSTPQEEPQEVVAEQPTEETPAVEPQPEQEPEKVPAWAQKRFDKMAAQRGQAERRAEYLEQQLMDKSRQPQQQPETQQQPVFQEKPPVLPDRFDYDEDDKYRAAQTKYQDDLGNFIQGQNQRAQETLYQQVNQAKQQRSAQEFIENTKTTGSEKYDDFGQVAFIPKGMEGVFAQTQNAADIAYHLGNNQQDLQRIMQLPPAQAVFEIAKLDAKFSAAPAKKTTNAPNPITPVSGGGGSPSTDDDTLSDADWAKKHMK